MSYLLTDEFNDSIPIESTFRIQHKGIKLGYVRAHCIKHGTISSGTFNVIISQDGTDLGTSSITATEIDAISGTYAHGMFTWSFTKPIHLGVDPTLDEQEYEIRFESSGYTGDSSNFFSVCKDFDNVFIQDYGVHFNETTPEQQACTMPYGLELYKWDNR